MAKCSLVDHWKFRRLSRALGSPVVARGVLELLWWSAYRLHDPYIGNADDIADALDWTRTARLLERDPDPTALAGLLKTCGFLDEPTPGHFLVHDLWDHAPPFVRLRWLRENPNKTAPWAEAESEKATSYVVQGGEGQGRDK